MKTTATELTTYWTCPFLRHAACVARAPLPVLAARRRFGTLIHAAIAEYERRGRSLDAALRLLAEQGGRLDPGDAEEARAILAWRHGRAGGGEGRPWLVEGSLTATIDGHRLAVRVDRLDRLGDGLLLAEYKGGRAVDLERVRVQLRILAAAVRDVLGHAPARWDLELLRERTVVSLAPETDPARLRGFVSGLIRGLQDGDREPRPYDPAFCRRCPARAYCPRAASRPRPLPPAPAVPSAQGLLF